jgi:multidrug efflux system outer membrane protein
MRNAILAVALSSALAGCAVNQPAPPALDLPPPAASAADNALLERWWTLFDDPALTALIDEALAGNVDLERALARIELARAQVLLAQSNLVPSVNLAGGASRNRISGVGAQPLPPGTALVNNSYLLGLDMSYELDLWGKYRSGALASRNALDAARYSREAVRITVAADVAATYFRLRAADAELALLRDTLRSREDTVQLQQLRFDSGLIGEYDLNQALAERSSVVGNIARAEQAIGLLESALAVLTGRSPRAVFAPQVARAAAGTPPARVPELPAGLPSGLLERRPDLRATEARLAAADLRITEARADYYPSISLTGAYGSESAALANLFTSPAAVWGLGASLLQPIIGIKRVDAAVEAATANRDAALADYRQTVQTAFRDVHDALVVNRTAREIFVAESARRDQLAKALEVAQLRYDSGTTSFLEVLDAQRTLLVAETQRIGAARDAQLAVIGFAKSVGGGWSPAEFTAEAGAPLLARPAPVPAR